MEEFLLFMVLLEFGCIMILFFILKANKSNITLNHQNIDHLYDAVGGIHKELYEMKTSIKEITK